MDPERIKSYLQAACAGLGFDIGEVWWTQNESGSSTVAAIQEKPGASDSKNIRFVQLYTSKAYGDQRSKLLVPPSERRNKNNNISNNESGTFSGDESAVVSDSHGKLYRRNSSITDLNEHELSPRLVDAISHTTQVVWANCQKSEGLLGRSDVRLQTAVGMPVGVDANGNMCIVVMFSPNNIHSTDEAVEYLRFISESAMSTSIPCLLPVVDGEKSTLKPCATQPPENKNSNSIVPAKQQTDQYHLGEGVTARFVSFNNNNSNNSSEYNAAADAEIHTDHKLADAPKDCFGIPMLPSFAELGNTKPEENPAGSAPALHEAFDEASYGVWNTIMTSAVEEVIAKANGGVAPQQQQDPVDEILVSSAGAGMTLYESETLALPDRPIMAPMRRERLEEFSTAFLGMSVFDAADVWMPFSGGKCDSLSHVTSVTSTTSNEALNYFEAASRNALIKPWSGAAGRAFSSGNPVWSANQDVIVDYGRAAAFIHANIRTTLAVPIFSSGSITPSCVVCYYSLVRTDSVPFVLRFVQQALRLLWEGLDQVEPHEKVGKELWKDVAPADLGEMAADLEMQQAFLKKKRPHDDISPADNDDKKLSKQLQALDIPSEKSTLTSSDTSQQRVAPVAPVTYTPPYMPPTNQVSTPSQPVRPEPTRPMPPRPATFVAVQNHLQNAVRSVAEAVPWTEVHEHVPTNDLGTKRAHVISTPSPPPIEPVARCQSAPPPTTAMPHHIPMNAHIQHTPHYNNAQPIQPQPIQPQPHPLPGPLPSQVFLAEAAQNQTNQMPLSYVNYNNTNQYNQSNMTATVQQNLNTAGVPMQVHSSVSSPAVIMMGQSATGPSPSPLSDLVVTAPSPFPAVTMNVPSPSPLSEMGMPAREPTPPAQEARPDTVPSANGAFCLSTTDQVCKVVDSSASVSQLNLNGKACRIQGCEDFAVARRPYCLKHSGNRLCEHNGCTKCAQGSTRFCIAHGGGRRCTFPGCDKGARDKFFCAAHGGGKRCTHPGCTKSAVGGSNLCTSHGGGRRCAVEGCDKSAQSSTKYCVKHGGGKKCCHAGCEKVARGRTMFCAAHGGGVRCKLEGCNRVAIGKLQLCRTHGGGSRTKRPLPPQNFSNGTQRAAVVPPNLAPQGITSSMLPRAQI